MLSLSLPERKIGVKMTYGPVGGAPMSIPACCGHIVNSRQFPEKNSGSERLKGPLNTKIFFVGLTQNVPRSTIMAWSGHSPDLARWVILTKCVQILQFIPRVHESWFISLFSIWIFEACNTRPQRDIVPPGKIIPLCFVVAFRFISPVDFWADRNWHQGFKWCIM